MRYLGIFLYSLDIMPDTLFYPFELLFAILRHKVQWKHGIVHNKHRFLFEKVDQSFRYLETGTFKYFLPIVTLGGNLAPNVAASWTL